MSQCVSCNNQPNNNDSLGGASSEGTVTPVVIGIIIGTVAVFILVLCALFYCVKLENERSMRIKDEPPPPCETGKAGPPADNDNNNDQPSDPRAKPAECCRRRSSSFVTLVTVADREPRAAMGKKRGLFGWGAKKGGSAPADNPPVTAIEMV